MSRRRRKAMQQAAQMTQPVAPNLQDPNTDALHRVILAGQRIMYDPKTFPIFAQDLKKPMPVPVVLASTVAGLIKIIDEKSGGKIPRQLLVPAAVALMMDMAKFMVQAGLAKPSENDIKTALQKLVVIILQIYKPTPPGVPQGGATPPQAPAAPAAPAATQVQAQQQPTGLIGA